MTRIALLTAAALALAASPAFACDGAGHAQAKAARPEVKKVTVDEVAALQAKGQAKLVDANGAQTRARYGVIPGSVLLTSSTEYDPAKELPVDKNAPLVFYCASTRCTASHMAAVRAVGAGWANVSVMPDGIKGWKDAGKPTAVPNS